MLARQPSNACGNAVDRAILYPPDVDLEHGNLSYTVVLGEVLGNWEGASKLDLMSTQRYSVTPQRLPQDESQFADESLARVADQWRNPCVRRLPRAETQAHRPQSQRLFQDALNNTLSVTPAT